MDAWQQTNGSKTAISGIGLIPGCALLSLGLSGVKKFGEEVNENVDVSVETYIDFRLQELNTIYSNKGDMELLQRQDYTIMKYEDNLVKRVFPLTRFFP